MARDVDGDDCLWRKHRLERPGVDLCWYDAGDGPILVFLHGGPGLDHRTVRALAEPLTREYRCVLYDQRGAGESRLEPYDTEELHIDRHIEDLDALRVELGEQRLTLVGWSWGAMLALLYGAVHPERIERLASISAGPLTPDLVGVYQANSIRPLDASERAIYQELKARCTEALAARDAEGYRDAYHALTRLTIRVGFFSPDLAARVLPEYLTWIDDAFLMAIVQQDILASLGKFQCWDQIGSWSAPTLILYGYQDYEPVTQAFLLRDWIPDVTVEFINECGHWPWLEQPDAFYRILRKWLPSMDGYDV